MYCVVLELVPNIATFSYVYVREVYLPIPAHSPRGRVVTLAASWVT